MRYFISDLHIGHTNIIKYCNRPFSNVEEMDAILISNWNSVVGVEDTIYFLGDFSLSYQKACEVVPNLNGKLKIILLGNHDKNAKDMRKAGFHEAYQILKIKINERKFTLQHRPKPLLGFDQGSWQISGHTHNHSPHVDKENKIINVSCEWTAYKPISELEILKLANQ